LYGVDEDTVIDSWSMEKFERYRAAAHDFLELIAGAKHG
jgi:hypothetical protein